MTHLPYSKDFEQVGRDSRETNLFLSTTRSKGRLSRGDLPSPRKGEIVDEEKLSSITGKKEKGKSGSSTHVKKELTVSRLPQKKKKGVLNINENRFLQKLTNRFVVREGEGGRSRGEALQRSIRQKKEGR